MAPCNHAEWRLQWLQDNKNDRHPKGDVVGERGFRTNYEVPRFKKKCCKPILASYESSVVRPVVCIMRNETVRLGWRDWNKLWSKVFKRLLTFPRQTKPFSTTCNERKTIYSGVQDTESRDRDRNTFCNRRSHARNKHKHANKREDGPPDHRLSKLRRSAICLRAQRILGYKGHKLVMLHFTWRLTSSGSLTFFFCILHKIWGKWSMLCVWNHKERINFNRCHRIRLFTRLFTVPHFSVRSLTVTSLARLPSPSL